MNNYFNTYLLLFFLLLFCPALAQAEGEFSLARSQVIKFPSEATALEHRLVVVLPPSYEKSPERTYPTLYFLDAYWDAPLVYATLGNLSYDRVVPEMIMVGLSLPESTEIGPYRDRFFSPTQKSDKAASGQADKLRKMLAHEVIPFVEAHYRARPEHSARALAGQSMGGLFTVDTMLQKTSAFSRFIAINPAVAWDLNYFLNTLKNNQQLPSKMDLRAFISYGTAEYEVFRNPIIAFAEKLQSAGYQGLALKVQPLQGMRHTGGKGEAWAKGLQWVFEDLKPKGPSGLEQAMQ